MGRSNLIETHFVESAPCNDHENMTDNDNNIQHQQHFAATSIA